jgi:hypothetical protein
MRKGLFAWHAATLTLVMLPVLGALVWACGKERWPVKVATDPQAPQISAAPEPATIALLSTLLAPRHPENRLNSRYAPTELKTFEVTGSLIVIKLEPDQDYHIVIRDDGGRTMIVESPDPACATGSRFAQEITAVRDTIDRHFGGAITRRRQPRNLRVAVTGVGFFDRLHQQEGVASNGIELHPILEIVFNPHQNAFRRGSPE